MTDHNDRLFDVALKLQEQMGKLDAKFERDIGTVNTELAKQTEILVSTLGEVKPTNGRTTKNENDIKVLEDFKLKIETKSALFSSLWGFFAGLGGALILGLIKKFFGI